MNWEKLFEQKILNRGYSYFHDGMVGDFDVREGIITANVNGTEVYNVEIKLENDEIKDMSCSCPYAEGGKNCKHMAAVLYKWMSVNKSVKKEPEKPLSYYSRFYPHKIIAIKELRLDTGMELDEAKKTIEELFSKIDAKNEKQTGATNEVGKGYTATSRSKVRKKRDFGESFRLFCLKFWIVIMGWFMVEYFIEMIHLKTILDGTAVALYIVAATFVLLIMRHRYLRQYFDSDEYELKRNEKRRIQAEKQKQYAQQQRRAKAYKASHYSEPAPKQRDSGGSGCCLVALFLMIFYAPIRLIAGLTKKYY